MKTVLYQIKLNKFFYDFCIGLSVDGYEKMLLINKMFHD